MLSGFKKGAKLAGSDGLTIKEEHIEIKVDAGAEERRALARKSHLSLRDQLAVNASSKAEEEAEFEKMKMRPTELSAEDVDFIEELAAAEKRKLSEQRDFAEQATKEYEEARKLKTLTKVKEVSKPKVTGLFAAKATSTNSTTTTTTKPRVAVSTKRKGPSSSSSSSSSSVHVSVKKARPSEPTTNALNLLPSDSDSD